MAKKKLVWHKFPDEKPDTFNNYFVTIKDFCSTDISFYDKKKEKRFRWDGFLDEDIVAWAEIEYPEPFNKEK
jgi:hypothetical protein